METTTAAVFPPGIDDLIESSKAASADRLRLAKSLAQRDLEQGQPHLHKLATDHTLQPSHRVEAAEYLRRLTAGVLQGAAIIDASSRPVTRVDGKSGLGGSSRPAN